MQELHCENCPTHLGYISGSGPHGFVLCQECYEEQESESNENDDS